MFKNMNREELMKEFKRLECEKEELFNAWSLNEEDETVSERIDEISELMDEIDELLEKLDDGYDYYEHCDGQWKDWASNREVNRAMKKSIYKTNEEEVADFLNRARNACPKEKWFILDWIDNIEIINKYLRHGVPCLDSIFAVDHLENEGIWMSYKEPFETCLRIIAEYIGIEY